MHYINVLLTYLLTFLLRVEWDVKPY